ncbi:hypothetical protein JYU34_009907 [Plutella xylostella]|uniref:Calnexin n=1 Tax=Plutella xylostella TaxID=51655 RepID=A0ABQ7QLK8_PLUXY|nr:hypothetical protein JYU34_009907 [Plutella xylostella]
MTLLSSKRFLLSALLLSLGASLALAEEQDADKATVETVEEAETYHSPQVDKDKAFFMEHFDDQEAFEKKWVKSEAKKKGVAEEIAKYDGQWQITTPIKKAFNADLGLVLATEAKHAAVSALLDRPFVFGDKPLVVQYEVTMQAGQICGGAYLKLLSKGTDTKADLRSFHDQTPYTIMFGPDKCGSDNKLHFIFRHRNPVNGSIEEKHSKKPTERLEEIYKDKAPHLYTLIVSPDNTYSIMIDNKEVSSGSLLEDFTPPVNPPDEIDDPNDVKPVDWDEREKIVDSSAVKPEDWDESAPAQIPDPDAVKPDGWLDHEPVNIPDPEAKKPEDWDADMDGEWEAPLIDNPACSVGCGEWKPPLIPNPSFKGKWRPPLITNPNYKGRWAPRKIPNPDYFYDDQPFKMTPIHAIGFELWSMSPNLLFDNLLITDDPATAEQFAAQTFTPKLSALTKYEESFLDAAVQFVAANPWVWAVVVLLILVVIVIYIYVRAGPDEDVEEALKKADAMTPDDLLDEEEQEARGGKASLEEPADDEEQSTLRKRKKDDGSGDASKKKDEE